MREKKKKNPCLVHMSWTMCLNEESICHQLSSKVTVPRERFQEKKMIKNSNGDLIYNNNNNNNILLLLSHYFNMKGPSSKCIRPISSFVTSFIYNNKINIHSYKIINMKII